MKIATTLLLSASIMTVNGNPINSVLKVGTASVRVASVYGFAADTFAANKMPDKRSLTKVAAAFVLAGYVLPKVPAALQHPVVKKCTTKIGALGLVKKIGGFIPASVLFTAKSAKALMQKMVKTAPGRLFVDTAACFAVANILNSTKPAIARRHSEMADAKLLLAGVNAATLLKNAHTLKASLFGTKK